jgi:hypothetical protein
VGRDERRERCGQRVPLSRGGALLLSPLPIPLPLPLPRPDKVRGPFRNAIEYSETVFKTGARADGSVGR